MTTILLLCSPAALADTLTVGVMPFVNNSLADREAVQPLSQGLADMMSTELAKIGGLKIVERASLKRVIEELKLSMSGLIDESSVKEAGKMLGADLLLLGSYNHGFDGQIRIDARLVKVETGVTVKAEEATGKKQKVFALVNRLTFKMAENLKPALSAAEKKALDKTDNGSFEALMAYSQGLDAENAGDTASARKSYGKALSISRDYAPARRRLDALTGGGK